MLRNYLTVAWRNLIHNRLFSAINIFGLSLGLAMAVLIGLYLRHEYSYDRWMPEGDRTFRVYREWPASGGKTAYVTGMLAGALLSEAPEVEAVTRFAYYGEALVAADGQSLYLDGVARGDSLFFRTLSLPLQYGRPERALAQPGTAVISRRAAEQLWGPVDPLGKVVRIDNELEVTITGMLADFPGLSHLDDINLLVYQDEYYPSWTGAQCLSYVRLRAGVDAALTEEKISALANAYTRREYMGEGETPPDDQTRWRLQPVPAIHLTSADIGGHPGKAGDPRQMAVLSLLALVVLLIAGINYTNLSTARAARRAREVGIRKVSGATRRQTVFQFLTESGIQALIALGLGILLAELAMPAFNRVVDRDLSSLTLLHSPVLPALVGLTLAVGILAGTYPAFFLSAFRPVEILKGTLTRGVGGNTLRRSLVVVQFGLSIVLIVFIAFIWKQVRFMQTQELGFSDDQVLVAKLNTEAGAGRFRGTSRELLSLPGVRSASLVSRMPGTGLTTYNMNIQGVDEIQSIHLFFSDNAVANTLELDLRAGRFFDDRFPADTARAFVVNEAFVREYKLADPIGHRLKFAFDENWGEIVGVVADFHYAGLNSPIGPLILSTRPNLGWYSSVAIKIEPGQADRTLRRMEDYWGLVEPAHPFRYSFLDEDFARQYDRYVNFGRTILLGALLSIFVAMLGLFGLSTFTVEYRAKEIGIRKVLGASATVLAGLLVREFIRLIMIAGLFALPAAYLVVDRWLADFAYRTPVTVVPFLLSVATALLLALLTVGGQAYRSASANPVEVLRSE